jgi:hypothetical protein
MLRYSLVVEYKIPEGTYYYFQNTEDEDNYQTPRFSPEVHNVNKWNIAVSPLERTGECRTLFWKYGNTKEGCYNTNRKWTQAE